MADKVNTTASATPNPPPATPTSSPSQPTITSANLPREPIKNASVIDDADIVAKPLVGADFTNLRPANPNHSLRWGNRVAGGGARYDQLKAMNFRNALVADIHKETPVPVHYQKDGAIINGDLILMLIDRRDYVGQLKLNEQNAVRRLTRSATMETGKEKMREALNEVPGSAANKAKVKLYNPTL